MRNPSEVLQEFSEWQNDWKSHALFCAYDNDSSEEFILSFWKRALNKLFEESIDSLSIDYEELRNMVQRKGRFPTGLPEIVDELIRRGEFVRKEDLDNIISSKKAGKTWLSWAGYKFKGIWKQPEKRLMIVNSAKIKSLAQKVESHCKEVSKQVFTIEELAGIFRISEGDANILIDYLVANEKAVSFIQEQDGINLLIVKIKIGDKEGLDVKPEETATIILERTIKMIDKKVLELNETQENLLSKVKQELKLQNRENAKHFLHMKKMVEKKTSEILSSRLNVETQLLSIQQSITNRGIIETLKLSNETLKNSCLNINEVNEVIENSKNLIASQNEIGNLLSDTFEDNNTDNLLEEFQNLGEEIPSVPNGLPRKKQKISEESPKADLDQYNLITN